MSSDKSNDVAPASDTSGGSPTHGGGLQSSGMQAMSEKQRYLMDMQYKCALTGLIAAPILIFMPPRKLDFNTFGLCCLTIFCGNHVVKSHGHPGLLYAIAPNVLSKEYEDKIIKSRKPYEGLAPSEAIWKQMTDVWNQRYDDEEDATRSSSTSVLDEIRKEESKKQHSEVLDMLAEQEKKKKP